MKRLKRILPKRSGRDASGHVSVRHRGGRQKRFLREIDFARNKHGIPATVKSIEYDPNRNAKIALVLYQDGEYRYILSPEGLKVGDTIESGEEVPPKIGNALPLAKIPIGTLVHNIELRPGKGGQIARAAGASAVVSGHEDGEVILKMPSGEIRKFPSTAWATVGEVVKVQKEKLGKAGRKRHKGIRPTVRGVAMHPAAHPHGGGEGRSGEGMPTPKTPWGKPARGVKTRKKRKYSDAMIVQRRRIGYGAK